MKNEIFPVVIETPKGSTEKYDFDKKAGYYKLSKILPAGMIFPYDFGFIPRTKGQDGDPLDMIVISEFKSFPGCMMDCRLLGAIKAEQGRSGDKLIRNDRYLSIPVYSRNFRKLNAIEEISKSMITELEDFFINYNKAEGKIFKILGTLDRNSAIKQIKFK
ncbi:inorganic diphosphatase [Chitinophaga sp. MM2321]|uniref:inorganic diphosphatase n=1 Tax=Chitinophaga sp. MM2321 TaxID=3137178 RepID=UPI0032D59F5D